MTYVDALAADLPPHLREPRTYPHAQGLAALAAALALGARGGRYWQGALLITGLFPSPTCPGGVVVTWQERPVLVAPTPEEVWLYRPGMWEGLMTAVVRQRASLSIPSAPVEPRAHEETAADREL